MATVQVAEDTTGLSSEEAYKLLHIASRSIGNTFFEEMAEGLAQLLGVRWVLVSKVDRENSAQASTVVVWDNGPGELFDYDLEGSPCENILTQCACSYPRNLQSLFPNDQLLADMGAQAYVGIPISSSTGKVLGLLAVLHDAPLDDCQRIEEAIRLFAGRAGAELERMATMSANERLGRIVENSVSEAYVFSADTYCFELVNKGARENLGYTLDELVNLTPWDLKPDYSEADFRAFVAPLIEGDVPFLEFDTVHLRKDGSTYKVTVRLQYFPKPDHVFFASIMDTTAKREAEERERILIREVNHRSKNLLTLVQIVARQTAAHNPDDYVSALEQRIGALAANQDVLVHNCWTDIPLEDLLRSQLAHFGGLLDKRISLSGPQVYIMSTPAQAIGMAVHELATNAGKYGALSNGTGKVEISWSLNGDAEGGQEVIFDWKESGGPAVTQPDRQGFGTAVIDRQMKGLLGAEVKVDYCDDGLHYRVVAPADRVIDKAHS